MAAEHAGLLAGVNPQEGAETLVITHCHLLGSRVARSSWHGATYLGDSWNSHHAEQERKEYLGFSPCL